jgi:hypothetical protein
MSLFGTRTLEWLRWRWPAAILNDRPILSSERVLHRDYNRKDSIKIKTNDDRESQVVWRQEELIGGKPPVVK